MLNPPYVMSVVSGMKHVAKCGALIVAIPVLALTAACSSKESSKPASPPPVSRRAVTSAQPEQAAPGITQEELPKMKKVAECLKRNGVPVADPEVGKPFDTSGMDKAFGSDKAAFDKAMTNCPSYKKDVIGVG